MLESEAKTKRPLCDDFPHPMQPIGWDGRGVIRFKQNRIVDALVEAAREGRKFDLNDIAIAVARGQYSNADQVQLAQLIGYSVSGFGDLSYVPESMVAFADDEAARISALPESRCGLAGEEA